MKLIRTLVAIALTGLPLAALPAHAEDMKEFRVGILGGENEADRLRNFACIQKHLGELFGIGEANVKLFPAADYDGVVQGLLGGTLDYADLGASGYAKIYLKDPNAVEPILTAVQTDGGTGYYSVIVARKDSGIAKLEDLKGKKLGFADPDSTSGYLIPLVELRKGGVDEKTYFSETGFGGGHEQVVQAVLDKKFDAGATWTSGIGNWDEGFTSGNLRKMVDKGLLKMSDIVEVWRSSLIPNGPTVVRSSLPADVKAKFKDFMMKLPETDKACFQATQGGDFKGFAEVKPEFYQSIIDARKANIGG
jgi:phosphonate transport system substrate-binding protein